MKKSNKALLALILGTSLTGAVSANKKGNTDKSGSTEKCEPMKCGAGKCGASMSSESCDEANDNKSDKKGDQHNKGEKDTKKKN